MLPTPGETGDKLHQIKECVEDFYQYFKENYRSYNYFIRQVFISSTEDETNDITNPSRPEFPILAPFVARFRGEFSKNVPAVEVSAVDGHKVSKEEIEFYENHFRYILHESNKKGVEYNCYTDSLSGGFSGLEVDIEYENELSFNLNPVIKNVFDPTMTGYDVMAETKDKSDGRYCFKLYPMNVKMFRQRFPDVDISALEFGSSEQASFESFKWSYKTYKDEIMIVCDFYEKEVQRTKIVKVSNGRDFNKVMTMREYNEFKKEWIDNGRIEQVPVTIGKPRVTDLYKIYRYRMIEGKIISKELTSFSKLPIVFVDGDSVLSKSTNNSFIKQVTIPLVARALSAQKLKNLCGESLIREIESVIVSPMIAPKEAIPYQHLDDYLNPQKGSILLYNQFLKDNPEVRLDPPTVIQRRPIPPEIANTFTACDSLTQTILGSYDASLARLTQKDVSGVAIQESMSLSNSSVMPYVNNFMRSYQTVAEIILDLIPKLYKGERSIPTMTKEGKKENVKINQEGGLKLTATGKALNIKVDVGSNFDVQQHRAINQIEDMSKNVPGFGDFIGKSCLDLVVDNINVRNADLFKERSIQYMAQMQQAQQMMMQKGDPNMEFVKIESQKNQQKHDIETKKIRQEIIQSVAENRIKEAELEIERQRNEIELLKATGKIEIDRAALQLEAHQAVQHTEKAAEKALNE